MQTQSHELKVRDSTGCDHTRSNRQKKLSNKSYLIDFNLIFNARGCQNGVCKREQTIWDLFFFYFQMYFNSKT